MIKNFMKKRLLWLSVLLISSVCIVFINVLADNNEDITSLQTFFNTYNDSMTIPIASQLTEDLRYNDAIVAYKKNYIEKKLMYDLKRSDLISESLYNKVDSHDNDGIDLIVNVDTEFSNIIEIITHNNSPDEIVLKTIFLSYMEAKNSDIVDAENFAKTIKNEYYTYDISDYLGAGCLGEDEDPISCSALKMNINNMVSSDNYTLEQVDFSLVAYGENPSGIYITKNGVVVGIKQVVKNVIENYIYIPAETPDTELAYTTAGRNYFDEIIPNGYTFTFNKSESGDDYTLEIINNITEREAIFRYKLVKNVEGASDIVDAVNDYVASFELNQLINYYDGSKDFINLYPYNSFNIEDIFDIFTNFNYNPSSNIRIETDGDLEFIVIGYIDNGMGEQIIYTRSIYPNLIPQKNDDDTKLAEVNQLLTSLEYNYKVPKTTIYNVMKTIDEDSVSAFSDFTYGSLNAYLGTSVSETDIYYHIIASPVSCSNTDDFDCSVKYLVSFKKDNVFYGLKIFTYSSSNIMHIPYNASDTHAAIKNKIAHEISVSEELINITNAENNNYNISYDDITFQLQVFKETTDLSFEKTNLNLDYISSGTYDLETLLVKNPLDLAVSLTWTSSNTAIVAFTNASDGVITIQPGARSNEPVTITVSDGENLSATMTVTIIDADRRPVAEAFEILGDHITFPFSKQFLQTDIFALSHAMKYVNSLLPEGVRVCSMQFNFEEDTALVRIEMGINGGYNEARTLEVIYAVENEDIKDKVDKVIDYMNGTMYGKSYHVPINIYYEEKIADNLIDRNEAYDLFKDTIRKDLPLDDCTLYIFDNGHSGSGFPSITYYYMAYIIHNGIFYDYYRFNISFNNAISAYYDEGDPNSIITSAKEQIREYFPTVSSENIEITAREENDNTIYYLNVDNQGEVIVNLTTNKPITISEITTTDTNPIALNTGSNHTFATSFKPILRSNSSEPVNFVCFQNSDKYRLSSDCKTVTALKSGTNIPVRICLEDDENVCIIYYLNITGLPEINFSLTPYTLVNSIISKISIGTTINNLIVNLGNISSTVIKSGSETYTTGNIKTGLTLIYKDVTYTLSVKGDVRGTGEVRMADVMKVANYLLDDTVIEGDAYLNAADVNDDGSVRMNDVMKMAIYIVDGGNL